MSTHSILLNEKQIESIMKYFPKDAFYDPSQYQDVLIKYDDCIITIYTSKKCVFAGKNADKYFNIFIEPKKVILPQAGSDEVGTGDFFGPICVCASYVDETIYQSIAQMNLTDSKQLSDAYIESIGPTLIEKVPHSLLILDNEKYNEVIQTYNLNQIKAKMHNKCYLNLQAKGYKLDNLCVVDDFCGKDLYYHYLANEKEIFSNLEFHTKAESQYIAVAIGSIISRYSFIQYFKAISEKYNMQFPKGASNIVDEFAIEFLQKYSFDELRKVAKLNFKNVEKIR